MPKTTRKALLSQKEDCLSRVSQNHERLFRTAGELAAALKTALGHAGPCLIEVDIDPTDGSPTMREWGTRVAAANGKPPRA